MPRWTFRTPSRLLANAPTELKALLITVRRQGDFGLRASRERITYVHGDAASPSQPRGQSTGPRRRQALRVMTRACHDPFPSANVISIRWFWLHAAVAL
jgi:hypothetical protein